MSCPHCVQTTTPKREPLLQSTLPDHPLERVATDMFELNGSTYLLLVYYFFRYIEVQKLSSTTSTSVITAMKAIFARHGVPAVMVSDNGPQFASREMREFSESYGFSQVTRSPHYPQANGQAERAVKTAKTLLRAAPDPYMALRTTSFTWCGFSPAELLMGRRLRTDIPQATAMLMPDWSYLQEFRDSDKKMKEAQKRNYDSRHRVKDLPALPGNQPVWVDHQDSQVPGEIIQPESAPRSYMVGTQAGTLRRNRQHIRYRLEENLSQDVPPVKPGRIVTRSQTSTPIRPPDRNV